MNMFTYMYMYAHICIIYVLYVNEHFWLYSRMCTHMQMLTHVQPNV